MSKKTASRESVQELALQRELAISAMSDNLRAVFTTIEGQLDDLKAQNIMQYHRIGNLLNSVSTRPDEYATLNGKDGVSVLAKALNMEKRALRFALQFYSCYNDEQLTELLQLRNEHTNYRLNFGHVKYLMSVTDVAKRSEYTIQAVAESLNPMDLHELIKRREGRAAGHGRSHTLPTSLTAQLGQILTFSRNFVNKQENVWNGQTVSVFMNMRNAEASQLTQEHVEMLQEIAELMQRMQVYAAGNVPLCVELISHIQTQMTEEEARITAENANASSDTTARTRRTRAVRTSDILAPTAA